MTLELTLFLLRLLSAVVLLAFFGLIGWFVYRDTAVTIQSLAAGARSLGHLVVVANEKESPAIGTRFPLLPVTGIGRASGNTIVLDDDYVSSRHSLIARRGDLWQLEDLGSRNGTLLNGIVLTETAVISPGDLITIGNVQLKLEIQ
ncbi:MAG: FHA domain-containing protein [Chloroflexi bacterium]|nr:FHA domain-containing protein [Chloroflexota bacterium]